MKVVKLKRLVDPNRPITYGIVQAGENVDGGVPYIRPTDMDEHDGVSTQSLLRTSPDVARSYSRSTLLAGDIVVSIGPSFGKTMIVPAELQGANLTQGTARIAPATGVVRRFLVWALQSTPVRSFWEASVGGATFRALNLGPLAETPIRIPPESGQRDIADYLDHETAEIDALIRTQSQAVDLLAERRRRVVDNCFPDFVSSPVALKHLGELRSGLTIGTHYEDPVSTFPYLRVANVQAGHLNLAEIAEVEVPAKVASRTRLQAGDVLMTEGGDRDKLARGALWLGSIDPMLHQNHVFAFRSGPMLDPEFLVYCLESSRARKYFDVTARKSTNLAATNSTIVKNFRVPHIPVENQRETVQSLQSELAYMDQMVADARCVNELARERRAALISAAVTGKIDVTGRRRGPSEAELLEAELANTR